MQPRQLRCSPARPAPCTDPPVLHLQESPVCHLGIQRAFFYSETEKMSQGAVNKKKHFSLKGGIRHWHRLPREALGSPYLKCSGGVRM